jgi:hypothetical protein
LDEKGAKAKMDAGTIDTNQLQRVPYRLTELWKHQKDDNAVYVMDGMEGHIYQLNITAGELWLLIDGKKTVETILADCLSAFDVDDPSEARAYLLECLDNFHNSGLIAFLDE